MRLLVLLERTDCIASSSHLEARATSLSLVGRSSALSVIFSAPFHADGLNLRWIAAVSSPKYAPSSVEFSPPAYPVRCSASLRHSSSFCLFCFICFFCFFCFFWSSRSFMTKASAVFNTALLSCTQPTPFDLDLSANFSSTFFSSHVPSSLASFVSSSSSSSSAPDPAARLRAGAVEGRFILRFRTAASAVPHCCIRRRIAISTLCGCDFIMSGRTSLLDRMPRLPSPGPGPTVSPARSPDPMASRSLLTTTDVVATEPEGKGEAIDG